ncbi:hypothetical protein AB0F72_08435 [Actinoplanes sp. NPDC023936]|uniref:hypothetical protein n=1 Tax=Actinoplanes sp. NPDC023936 TaxID=3154910 RepID=UPI0033CEB6C7
MSTVPQKMDKQFDYQRVRHVTSGDPMDLFVSVDDLAAYLAAQMRADLKTVRRQVKAELERRADAGMVQRWLDVHGQSLRPDRADHYFLPVGPIQPYQAA